MMQKKKKNAARARTIKQFHRNKPKPKTLKAKNQTVTKR